MKKPIVLVIMDGVGRGDGGSGDAVAQANTPVLDKLMATCPMTWLKAHGTAVGLPSDDDMGNSEVGHNALGCGQIYSQGAKLVQESIETGSLYQSKTWVDLTDNCLQNGKALHFIGLLSDGNVHSNISHLIAMLKKAREMGLKRVYCHILLDGRDVPATSALDYVDQLESVLAELNDAEHEYKIASGGGRMVITMDRYEANWPMVEKGWRTHVQAEGRQFASAREAIETYRAENPGMIDQDLLPFVVAHDGKPVAKIENGDSVILFNFRGDRAQEISLAFDRRDFDKFDRGDYTGVKFAGMLEYDGDLKIPMHYLVEPPVIRNTLTEVLCKAGVHEYAVSETQKYGHVTYFWNGNRSGKVDESLEDYAEVPSDVIPFEQAPAMKSVEITDLLVEAMASHKYQFLRCNYPNGDMVGHTGVLSAVITAMEAVDAGLARKPNLLGDYICGHLVQVYIIHDDHRGVAAQLKGILFDGGRSFAHDLQPRLAGAYQGDHSRDGALIQRPGHLAGRPGEYVDHACRESDPGGDFPDIKRCQRRLARGLDDAGAAGNDCRRDLQPRIAQGIIPGDMADHDADGTAGYDVIGIAVGRRMVVEGCSVDATRLFRIVMKAGHHPVEIAARGRIRAAGFRADQVNDLLPFGHARIAQFQHPSNALIQRCLCPGLLRAFGRRQRLQCLPGSRTADCADDFACGRIHDVHGSALAVHQFSTIILLIHLAAPFHSDLWPASDCGNPSGLQRR